MILPLHHKPYKKDVGHQKAEIHIEVDFLYWNLLIRGKCLQSDVVVTCFVEGGSSRQPVRLQFIVW